MARGTKKQLGKAKTDADRLGWALQFAQANLAEWRDGDWLNALGDATNLLFVGREVPAAGPRLYHAREASDLDLAKTLLTKLQPDLRDFIEQLRSGEPVEVPVRGSRIFLPGPQGLDYYDEPGTQDLKKGFVGEMLLRVGDLLTRIGLSRLKECPECGRLFLAVRRQRFDTPQCSMRDRLRRFRRKHPARAPGKKRKK